MSGLFPPGTLVSSISGFVFDSSLITLWYHLELSTVSLWYSIHSGSSGTLYTLSLYTLWYSVQSGTLYTLVFCTLRYSIYSGTLYTSGILYTLILNSALLLFLLIQFFFLCFLLSYLGRSSPDTTLSVFLSIYLTRYNSISLYSQYVSYGYNLL